MDEMNITLLTGVLTVARDDFKQKYGFFKDEYKATLKENKEKYRAGSQYERTANQKAKEVFEDSLDELRKEVRDFAKPSIERLREIEYAKVRKIDTAAMDKLRSVSSLPLSAAEIGILQQKFAPDGQYWETRMIAEMAERNGLNPMQYMNGATLDVKLDVLRQEEEMLEKLLAEYDGTPRYKTEALLADAVLLRAENVYTTGWKSTVLEDEDTARRAFMQLRGKNPVTQGIALANIYRNASIGVREALFYEMVKDKTFIDDGALKFAGIKDEFEAFESGNFKTYSEARDGIRKTAVATSKEEIGEIADSMKENKYYAVMLEKEAEKNNFAKEYLESKRENRENISE